MKYFIPAWYSEQKWWRDFTVPHFDKRQVSDFDDMMSLMHIFETNNEDFQTIILNYQPDLRCFLHRHHLLEINYWSVFDEIQGFTGAVPRALSFKHLSFGQGTEFVYTPQGVIGYTDTGFYKMYYNQEGYLIWVEDYQSDILIKRYVFDDRGYLSSIRIYNDRVLKEVRYMSVRGDVIMTEHLSDGSVVIADNYQHQFLKSVYYDMAELIKERFTAYTAQLQGHFFVASHKHHVFIQDIIATNHLIYSFFTGRNKENEIVTSQFKRVEKLLVDTSFTYTHLKNYFAQNNHQIDILKITPFDTTISPNKSSEMYFNYIGVIVDELSDTQLIELMHTLYGYLKTHHQIKIMLISRKHYFAQSIVREKMAEINQHFIEQEKNFEDLLQEKIDEKAMIKLIEVPFEQDLLKVIRSLRVIVDMSQQPDLYLQIASISAGIPQINRVPTDYMKQEVNGLLIDSISELSDALDFYILSLKHWNHAYTYSLELANQYSSKQIVKRINTFIGGHSNEREV
ncbi:accessory Sec system protein Asp1 [Macrococcoides caseolyticum]|uniref:accessory Sec system protein Asp1 n=1 Tax=Macrococcoides caseolyticum TaxID=69966 RepID=UPI001F392109|nr:accessory Sec system protein Asp1 [Macrococcus caseolyticus]MCE4957551.1 accessory Sec system protein Asp1 [Macrococcus caseolyticus]